MNKDHANIIIGGTGFIGTSLAKELIQRGEKVVSISRKLPEVQKDGIDYYALDAAVNTKKLQEVLGIGNTIFLLTGQNYLGFDASREGVTFSKILDHVKTSSPD